MHRKWLLLVVVILTMILAAACGSSDNASPTTTTPSSNKDSETPAGNNKEEEAALEIVTEPAELVFYYTSPADWTEETFMRTFGNPIKEKYPHITPKFAQNQGSNTGTSLPELITIGAQIDVVFVSTGLMSRFTDVELQEDITPILTKFNFDDSHIAAPIMETGRIIADGGLYGLPVYTVPATMYYNKDIFDRFGVKYPSDGLTWDETYDLAVQLSRTDDQVTYYGLRTSLGHFAHLNQFSLHMVEPDTNRADFSSDKWGRFFNNIVRFYQISDAPVDRAGLNLNRQRDGFFAEQNVAMWLALTNLHNEPEITPDLNWDIAPFPTFPELGDVGPQPYPTYFNVSTTSEYKDQAVQAIMYLTSKEFQMQKSLSGELLTILDDPEVRAAFGQGDSIYKGKNVSALVPKTYAVPGNITKYDSRVRSKLEVALFDVITGVTDVNTALRTAQEEANNEIEVDEKG